MSTRLIVVFVSSAGAVDFLTRDSPPSPLQIDILPPDAKPSSHVQVRTVSFDGNVADGESLSQEEYLKLFQTFPVHIFSSFLRFFVGFVIRLDKYWDDLEARAEHSRSDGELYHVSSSEPLAVGSDAFAWDGKHSSLLDTSQTPQPESLPPPVAGAKTPNSAVVASNAAPVPAPAEEEEESVFSKMDTGTLIMVFIILAHVGITGIMVLFGIWGWQKKSFWGHAVLIVSAGITAGYGTKLLLDLNYALNFVGNAICVALALMNSAKAIPSMCCNEAIREQNRAFGGLLCQSILHLLITICFFMIGQFCYASANVLLMGVGMFIGVCMMIWGYFAGDESIFDGAMEWLQDTGAALSNAAGEAFGEMGGALGFGDNLWQGPNTVHIRSAGEKKCEGTYEYVKADNAYYLVGCGEPEKSKYIINYTGGTWQVVLQKKGTVLYYGPIGSDPLQGPPDKGWSMKEGKNPVPKFELEDFSEVSVLVDFKAQMDSISSMSNQWAESFGLSQPDSPEVPRTICVVSRFANLTPEHMSSFVMCFDSSGNPVPESVVTGKQTTAFNDGILLKYVITQLFYRFENENLKNECVLVIIVV